jgi:hypothetical protein
MHRSEFVQDTNSHKKELENDIKISLYVSYRGRG